MKKKESPKQTTYFRFQFSKAVILCCAAALALCAAAIALSVWRIF